MRPIKILGIAPYEGIASLMQQAAESCDGLQIDVHVGNLTAGAEIAAAKTAQEEYDVILSRGGTAEAIRRCTDLKVVDIPLSVYDILRCRGIIRVDYIVRDNEIFMLEVNTTPGMTSNSFIPKMVRAMGGSIRDIFTKIIDDSLMIR